MKLFSIFTTFYAVRGFVITGMSLYDMEMVVEVSCTRQVHSPQRFANFLKLARQEQRRKANAHRRQRFQQFHKKPKMQK